MLAYIHRVLVIGFMGNEIRFQQATSVDSYM